MKSLINVALVRPYTFIVAAIIVLILGTLSIFRSPIDIFPEVEIPVVAIAWDYKGLPPAEMAGRIITPFERALTATVNDIERIESNSYSGSGIVKVYFYPTVDINLANAQITSIAQTKLADMPDGTKPPLILNYTATTVPVVQLALSGEGLSEQELSDLAKTRLRSQLVTVQGAAIPYPFGGKVRQIKIDLYPDALQARGLSAQDVADALAQQNVIIPAGTQKIGDIEYAIDLNNSPDAVNKIAAFPVRAVNGTMIYVRDVASVRDGSAVQTNIVNVDGKRSVLLSVYKRGSTSTLALVAGIRAKIEEIKPQLPDSLEVKFLGDQSGFVRGAVNSVVIGGVIAACLTGLMILLFLGSWRPTLIVATTIPLSILGAVFGLNLLGNSLNIMTLGGLALAVGILVDLATVSIENIDVQLKQGKPVEAAIRAGSEQIIVPTFVSLLCICVVFVPMYLLAGLPKYLFVPLAEAVILAMVFAFLLAFTLVPTLAKFLLKAQPTNANGTPTAATNEKSAGVLTRIQRRFEAGFETVRSGYRKLLERALQHRLGFIAGISLFVGASGALLPFIGQNFFPTVDGGQIMLHARAPAGTRVEETAARFAEIESAIREVIPAEEVAVIVQNLGTYDSSINNIYSNNGTIGSQDGDLQISLAADHQPSSDYIKYLREYLPERFPDMVFSFLPGDIVSQILNFGSPAAIDIQIRGYALEENFAYASQLLPQLRQIAGLTDVRIQQTPNAPAIAVNVDRTQALYAGITQQDITDSMVVNLAGSSQVAPTYWLDPANGNTYPIVIQTPQYRLNSFSDLKNLPINAADSESALVLGGMADIERTRTSGVVTKTNIQPVIQVYAAVQGTDLGSVSKAIEATLAANMEQLPKGSSAVLSGQPQTMQQAYSGLLLGLLGSVILVYLLLVINFQSWVDPLIVIGALPAALAGILWMLFTSGTTFSVPALTGAIMCMGIATANSVLVISFARESLATHGDPVRAAVEAGYSRIRPVIMTALATIIGMLPMALALGEGGAQNAPLGRAVIGGLLFATAATLLLVPVLFSLCHRQQPADDDATQSAGESYA